MITGLYDVSNRKLFNKRVSQAKANGYVWAGGLPDLDQSFDRHKGMYHGNSKLILHLYYNTITGKKEMCSTTKSVLKSYPQYRNLKFEIL